ncbi:MAG TPA: ATP-binding protein [Acidimicrobiia bacterium]
MRRSILLIGGLAVVVGAVVAVALDGWWAVVAGAIAGFLVLWLGTRPSLARMEAHASSAAGAAQEATRRAGDYQERWHGLDLVLAAVPQGLILVEGDDVTYANPAARDLLGMVPDRLGGVSPLALQRIVREARTQGRQVAANVEHGLPPHRLQLIAVPLSERDQVVAFASDITRPHRTDAMRRDFVAAASHELKTPVAAILASAETLQLALDHEPESARKFAAQVESSARQLAGLVNDLLDLSRLESDLSPRHPLRLDLLAEDEAERVAASAKQSGVHLDVEADEVTVTGNPADLGLAVRNLLENAVRHTPPEGNIRLGVFVDGRDAVVSVADTGEGIPQRDLPRIFERFYRVDTARSRATGGTGLGLAIVRHVAEGHEGSVTVESELGVGSTFRLRLPLPV